MVFIDCCFGVTLNDVQCLIPIFKDQGPGRVQGGNPVWPCAMKVTCPLYYFLWVPWPHFLMYWNCSKHTTAVSFHDIQPRETLLHIYTKHKYFQKHGSYYCKHYDNAKQNKTKKQHTKKRNLFVKVAIYYNATFHSNEWVN